MSFLYIFNYFSIMYLKNFNYKYQMEMYKYILAILVFIIIVFKKDSIIPLFLVYIYIHGI